MAVACDSSNNQIQPQEKYFKEIMMIILLKMEFDVWMNLYKEQMKRAMCQVLVVCSVIANPFVASLSNPLAIPYSICFFVMDQIKKWKDELFKKKLMDRKVEGKKLSPPAITQLISDGSYALVGFFFSANYCVIGGDRQTDRPTHE